MVQREFDNFSAHKNWALDTIDFRHEWILIVDADERVTPELAREIAGIVSGSPPHQGYYVARQNWFAGVWIRHGGWYPDRKVRLVRRSHARWGGEDPHDKLAVEGKTRDLSGNIRHYVYADISHQLRTVDSFSRITALQWFTQGRRAEAGAMIFKTMGKFFETYVWKLGMLDGMPGFIISVISVASVPLSSLRWAWRGWGRSSGSTGTVS